MKKFKDACDACGKFDYCVGHEGKVLCPQCMPVDETTTEVVILDEDKYRTTSGLIELFTQSVCNKE